MFKSLSNSIPRGCALNPVQVVTGLSVSVRCGEGGWRQAGEIGAHAPSGVALFVSLVPFVCSLRKLLEGLGCSSAWLSPPLLLKCTVLHILWAGAACRLGRSLVVCPRSGTFSHSFIQVLSCSVLGFGAGGKTLRQWIFLGDPLA